MGLFLGINPIEIFTHMHKDIFLKIFSMALFVVKKN